MVVPAGPGDEAWRALLPQLEDVGAQEVALVLTRRADDRMIEALSANVTLVVSHAGRSHQLNAGAAATSADWLWFLHADSQITPDSVRALRQFIHSGERAIGYFELHFLRDGPRWTRINAWGASLRSRWLGLPFGDQGFVMPRTVFEALGRFDEGISCGEDHALVWAAHAFAIPLRALSAPIYTSARKYAQHGWWITTRQHLLETVRQARRFSREV
ncbi:MAG: glycosyltransferase [Proteobacteria bacterium]|nr:glycosyltransferase [Pseudomonadota bacterium]